MRVRLPSSRASLRVRLSPVDVTLAAVSPYVALHLRNVDLASAGGMIPADSFALISFAASLIAFRVYRISSTIPRYISVGDLLNLAKAAVAGALMTAMVLFTITRLDGIPRSVPAVHALILGAALLTSRGLASVVAGHRRLAERPQSALVNIILIGLNDWSVLLLKLLRNRAWQRWRIIALLDEEPRWFGRSVDGVQVFGPSRQLEPLVEEFATHGVRTDRVVVGSEAGFHDHAGIRGDVGAFLENKEVPPHNLVRRNLLVLAVSNDAGASGKQLAEGVDGALRAVLLDEPHDGVQEHDDQDGHRDLART